MLDVIDQEEVAQDRAASTSLQNQHSECRERPKQDIEKTKRMANSDTVQIKVCVKCMKGAVQADVKKDGEGGSATRYLVQVGA